MAAQGSSPFKSLPPQIDLPATEHQILNFWEQNEIFAKSVSARDGAPGWTFYEGPPTANGSPGTHHIEARAFKDLFPRYQTMKGMQVVRKAGWDCHGLPVEIAVEKELGFSGKGDIEKYGIAAFNEKCRESVQRHVDEFTAMTRRMGFWVDFERRCQRTVGGIISVGSHIIAAGVGGKGCQANGQNQHQNWGFLRCHFGKWYFAG